MFYTVVHLWQMVFEKKGRGEASCMSSRFSVYMPIVCYSDENVLHVATADLVCMSDLFNKVIMFHLLQLMSSV